MPTILVVEDDRHQRLLLTEELEDEGYTVRSAASAQEALARVSEAMPALVVVDIGLPGMDGIELLAKLLAISNRLPIVIHTAYSSYQDNFMTWPADAYVIKQSDMSELKKAIREALGRSQATQGHRA